MAAHAMCAKEERAQTRTEGCGSEKIRPEKNRSEKIGTERIRLEEIGLELIEAVQAGIRTQEDDEAFEQLCDSIRMHGLIEPIAVRECAGRYALVTGGRRLEACRKLGFSRIPAQIFSACDACEAWLMSLSENLHRRALHYFEEAQGYRHALDEFGLTQEQLSRRVGRSQSAIANKLRLLQLDDAQRTAIRRAALSERHARALLMLEDGEARMRLIALCAQQEITVRQLETLIAQEQARKQASGEKRILLIMHDQRLYINAIRDIVSQMKASGIRADMKLEDLGDRIEMRVTLPRRGVSSRKD